MGKKWYSFVSVSLAIGIYKLLVLQKPLECNVNGIFRAKYRFQVAAHCSPNKQLTNKP